MRAGARRPPTTDRRRLTRALRPAPERDQHRPTQIGSRSAPGRPRMKPKPRHPVDPRPIETTSVTKVIGVAATPCVAATLCVAATPWMVAAAWVAATPCGGPTGCGGPLCCGDSMGLRLRRPHGLRRLHRYGDPMWCGDPSLGHGPTTDHERLPPAGPKFRSNPRLGAPFHKFVAVSCGWSNIDSTVIRHQFDSGPLLSGRTSTSISQDLTRSMTKKVLVRATAPALGHRVLGRASARNALMRAKVASQSPTRVLIRLRRQACGDGSVEPASRPIAALWRAPIQQRSRSRAARAPPLPLGRRSPQAARAGCPAANMIQYL